MQPRLILAMTLVIALVSTPLVAGQVTYSFNGGPSSGIDGLSIEARTPVLVVRPNATVETTFVLKNGGNATLNLSLGTMSMTTGGSSTYVIRPVQGSANATSRPPSNDTGTVDASPGGNATGGSVVYSGGGSASFKPALNVSVAPQNVSIPAGETLEVRLQVTASATADGDHQVMLLARLIEDDSRSASGSVTVKVPKSSGPRTSANDSRRSTLLDDEPAETPLPGLAAFVVAGLAALAFRRPGGRP